MKRYSYLSERKYQHSKDGKSDNIKKRYWERMLGEDVMNYLCKNSGNFCCYLSGDEYYEEENIEKGLLTFFSDEKNVSRGRVEWNDSGNGKKLFFVEFYDRLLDYGIGKLKQFLKSKDVDGYDSLDLDFGIHLAFQLQNICLRTLVSEMHSYKQRGLLSGKDEKEEYSYFCGHIVGSTKFENELFTQYPVLCRCVEEKTESLAAYYAEVIVHFSEDKIKLQEMCGKKPEYHGISKIIKITGDFSDQHQNGKQVLRLRCDNGMELFYKPRSMENEKSYQELLDWISRRTGTKQHFYSFLSFSDHSWSSVVEYKSCKSEGQLKRYYIRLGEQLFLAYLLGTKDLHYENIVASGEYPALIDLENLVNLQHNQKRITVNDEVHYQLSQSVLFMGILPFYYRSREWQGVDTSAVSGMGGQVYPFKVPAIMEAETSGMYIGYKNPISDEARNRARLNGDIPYFYYKLDSTGLCTVQGEEVGHYFSEPAIDILYRRLASLEQEDLEKQCAYIQIAFALMPGRKEGYRNRVYPVSTWRLNHQKILDVQTWIRKLTGRVLQYAVWNGEHTEVSWAAMHTDPQGSPVWNMKGMDMYLYNGLAGMLLLFYKMDSLEENGEKREEIHSIFLALEHQLFRYTDAGCGVQENLQSKNTGAYQGESSILYVYLALYTMSKDELYLEYARKHADIVNRILDEDVKYDLVYGNAGAAHVLLYLYEVTKEGAFLSMAERAIAVLTEAAQRQAVGIGWVTDKDIPPMGGMAHGNAGILMPVMQLWRLTGKEEYERLAEEIWQYENFLYDPGIKNWMDIRGKDMVSDSGEIGAVAWCHGAAGILLSRIFCYAWLDKTIPLSRFSKAGGTKEDTNSLEEKWEKRLSEEIKIAYQTVNQYLARDSWSLCHGICGNLWILEMLELVKEGKYGSREESSVKKTGDGRILYGNEINLLPQEMINPGIMNGYGGILYYLLHRKEMEKSDVNSKYKKLEGRKSITHVQMLVLR